MHFQKKWLCTLGALFFFHVLVTAQDSQEAAIKKAIDDQNAAIVKHDVEAWKASWLQDDKVFSVNTDFFGTHVKKGWKDMSEDMLKFLQSPADSVEVTTDSFMVRREGNMAVANFKQDVKMVNGVAPFDKFSLREQRVLIKKNGKWLVAAASSYFTSTMGLDGAELALNAVGYNYMFAGKNEEAIKVLELNTVLFPGSFNVWDSLGEAYAKAGDKEKARTCYEKSLAINPANETGKKALADLK